MGLDGVAWCHQGRKEWPRFERGPAGRGRRNSWLSCATSVTGLTRGRLMVCLGWASFYKALTGSLRRAGEAWRIEMRYAVLIWMERRQWHLSHSRARSEERRVGKECRSRWSRCHDKKNRSSKARGQTTLVSVS